jgi:hypothetical protein
MTKSAIVYLLGFPASGKYTIARALADTPGRPWTLIDNHHINNVILSTLRDVSPLPPQVWELIGEVREAVFHAIETLSHPSVSFILTNVLLKDLPRDHQLFQRVRAVAQTRGSAFVPVLLRCEAAELERRAYSTNRIARLKMSDPGQVRAYAQAHELLQPSEGHALELDVTSLPPKNAAQIIARHIDIVLAG